MKLDGLLRWGVWGKEADKEKMKKVGGEGETKAQGQKRLTN